MLQIQGNGLLNYNTTPINKEFKQVELKKPQRITEGSLKKVQSKRVSFSGPKEIWDFIYCTIYNPIQYPDD